MQGHKQMVPVAVVNTLTKSSCAPGLLHGDPRVGLKGAGLLRVGPVHQAEVQVLAGQLTDGLFHGLSAGARTCTLSPS